MAEQPVTVSQAPAAGGITPAKEEKKVAVPAEGKVGGIQQVKDKYDEHIKPHATFEKLSIIDGIWCGLHLLTFMCVSFMFLMLLPLLFIRVPRIVIHELAKKKKDDPTSPWRYREFIFRKYSLLAYPIVAFIFQIINGCAIYCYNEKVPNYAEEYASSCRTGYVVSFLIFIAIHTAFDFAVFKYIVSPELEHEKDPTPPKVGGGAVEKPADIETKTANRN